MLVRLYGTRGSVPAPGPHTVAFGGNTSCLAVQGDDGRVLVLDAGTGIRSLGLALAAAAAPLAALDVFVTHAHWDHVQGLPFFAPLYEPGLEVRLWAPTTLAAPLDQVVEAMFAPAVFPVGRAELGAALAFPQIGAEPVTVGALRVAALPALHPGGAAGFRVQPTDAPGRALLYFPDNEVGAPHGGLAPDDWRRRFRAFARGARTLVHDAMYTPAEHATRRGWGHSTVDDAVDLALEAEIPELVLFHHAPERSDAEVEALLTAARERADARGGGVRIRAAAEGAEL